MNPTRSLSIDLDTSPARGEIQALRREVESLKAELDGLNERRSQSPRVQILSEPLTYDARLVRDKDGQRGFRAISTRENRSYIRDFVLAETKGEQGAIERLTRHTREMKVLSEARDEIFHPSADYDFESRAVNWTNGTGGYFAPPLWIVEQFAHQPTPERVLTKLAPKFELPVGAQSVNLPAWSAGGEVGSSQVGAAAMSTDTLDSAISSAVTTMAGNYDVPMQMLEQSPQGAHLDWVAFTTMEARYGFQLELALFTGTGAKTPQGSGNNQLLGIYNNTAIPTANQVAFANAGVSAEAAPGVVSAGATAMFGFIGFLVSKVGQTRLLPPEAWMMSTSRGAWLGSSEDTQSRPLMIADNASETGVWDLLGFPVYLNDAIPRTSGVGGNEDRIIVCRPSDWLILESERRTQVMTDVLSGTLQARLQMRRYVAALLRYPTSVAFLTGAGMATGGGW